MLFVPVYGQTQRSDRRVAKFNIMTPPHKWLGGKQVWFPIPRGWTVTALPPDETDFPKDWWRENWNKTGIEWRFAKTLPGQPSKVMTFKFNVLMTSGSHSDTFRPGDEKSFTGKSQAFQGFDYVRNYDYEDFDVKWIIIKVPETIAKNRFLVCSVTYRKKYTTALTSEIKTIEQGVFIR